LSIPGLGHAAADVQRLAADRPDQDFLSSAWSVPVKKYPSPKKTSSVKYVFGAHKAAQSAYAKGHNRLTRTEPSRLPSADEMLEKMHRGDHERKAKQ
jgi:hypothetical protein